MHRAGLFARAGLCVRVCAVVATGVNKTDAANGTHGERARPRPHGSRWGWRDCALSSAAVGMLSHCWMYEGLAVPLTKAELRRCVAEERCSMFHAATVRPADP